MPTTFSRKNAFRACLLLVCALRAVPVFAGDLLFTLRPTASMPLGSTDVQYTVGVGGQLAVRPYPFLDLFFAGDYTSLSLPGIQPVSLLNGAIGASYNITFSSRLSLRVAAQVGAYRASHSDGVLTGPSMGISLALSYRLNPVVSLEGGVGAGHFPASPRTLLTNVQASPGITLNLTEIFTDSANVRAHVDDIQPVFPVLYSWYERNAFATATVQNEEDSRITDVSVSFFQPEYMSRPHVCARWDAVEKGGVVQAGLTAFFNERMLSMIEKTDTEAKIIVEYSYLGQRRSKEFPVVIPVYGRNSMSWDDDRRAAVFVSSRDPAAQFFAKNVTNVVADNLRPGVSKNIQYAMGIFEALDAFGINYVIDPASAYADNVGSSSIDFLQFPYQTLSYRGGDCDDLSILMCALLEAVDIRTAFITVPGHIYMAFDSGMTMEEAAGKLVSAGDLIDYGGEAWLPIEITVSDEGFSRAWRLGAREWNQAAAEGTAAFFPMQESWELYRPVSIPGASANFSLPDADTLAQRFQTSMDAWLVRQLAPSVAGYEERLSHGDTPRLRNEFGVFYGSYGLFELAREQFDRAGARYRPSLLNRANVLFSEGRYQEALAAYKRPLAENPQDVYALLGIARAAYELADYDTCDGAYARLKEIDPALAAEYGYLTAFVDRTGRSYSLADRLLSLKWMLDEDAAGGVVSGADISGYRGLVAQLRLPAYIVFGNTEGTLLATIPLEPLEGEGVPSVPDSGAPPATGTAPLLPGSGAAGFPGTGTGSPSQDSVATIAELSKLSDRSDISAGGTDILRSTGYYVQIDIVRDPYELFSTYSATYPMAAVSSTFGWKVLIGPLSVDEYGAVYKTFTGTYGFADAFIIPPDPL